MSAKLEQAIAAIKAGDKATGKQLLAEVLKQDRKNEVAWLWLTQTGITHEEKIKSLQNVLNINPNNQAARRGLTQLQGGNAPPESVKGLLKQPFGPVKIPTPEIISFSTDPVTKQCPYCAETIKAEATVCRFCGKDLRIREELRQTTQPKRSKSVSPFLIIAAVLFLGCVGLCSFPFLLAALSPLVPSELSSTSPDSISTSTSAPAPTVPALIQGGIRVTRQELVQHFESRGFSFRSETRADGTHFMSGESPDGTQKLNLWSSNNPEDLTEISFSFNFPHETYSLSNRNEDQAYSNGIDRMIEVKAMLFPDWNDGEDWIRTGIQSLPEPLSSDEEIARQVGSVEVYLTMGDLSGNEYSVSFDALE